MRYLRRWACKGIIRLATCSSAYPSTANNALTLAPTLILDMRFDLSLDKAFSELKADVAE